MKCKFVKSNKQQCQANAMSNSDYCFHHNPSISKSKKKKAQSKGGRANKTTIKEPLSPVTIKELKDVVVLLGDTVNRVRAGQMDAKIANCLFYGSGQLIRALQASEIEKRVEAIEEIVFRWGK